MKEKGWPMKPPLLQLVNLGKEYDSGVTIKDISFTMEEGQFVALIGESGSGKTTIGKMIAGMMAPTSGTLFYKGQVVTPHEKKARKAWATKVQQIFQNPYNSLNRSMKVKDIILEGIHYHDEIDYGKDKKDYLKKLMDAVELAPSLISRYPRELSGGQCQRVSIARALAMKPHILIADECISSLDSIHQQQILDLFLKIKKDENVACLFITHDMQALQKIADEVIVLKEGQIVEAGRCQQIVANPQHPYTKKLIEATFILK